MPVMIKIQLFHFMKDVFEKYYFEKKSQQTTKSMEKYPACKELNSYASIY